MNGLVALEIKIATPQRQQLSNDSIRHDQFGLVNKNKSPLWYLQTFFLAFTINKNVNNMFTYSNCSFKIHFSIEISVAKGLWRENVDVFVLIWTSYLILFLKWFWFSDPIDILYLDLNEMPQQWFMSYVIVRNLKLFYIPKIHISLQKENGRNIMDTVISLIL